MNILHVYGNHPGKTVFTVLLVIVGAITFFKFQTVEVPTFQLAVQMIFGTQDMKPALWTLGANFFTAVGLGIASIWWFKDSLKSNYNTDPTLNAIVCMSTGTVAGLLTVTFFGYIYSSLLGLVIVAIIVGAFVYGSGNEGSTRKRSY